MLKKVKIETNDIGRKIKTQINKKKSQFETFLF